MVSGFKRSIRAARDEIGYCVRDLAGGCRWRREPSEPLVVVVHPDRPLVERFVIHLFHGRGIAWRNTCQRASRVARSGAAFLKERDCMHR